MSTVLLTGVPRSGTSFVCACLNTAADCVALVEPMSVPMHGDAARAVAEILAFARESRARLLAEGVARSATAGGVIPDNTFEAAAADGGKRRSRITVADVTVGKPLTPGFRLVIKHPALFTALADPLGAVVPLFAMVRHPLAALASWQTVDMPVGRGRWPVAEAFAPELRALLDGIAAPLARQVALLGWMFRAYRGLPPGRVLRYEDIVADPARTLQALSGSAAAPSHPVHAIDRRTRYPAVDFAALAAALYAAAEDVTPYYPSFTADLDRETRS